jgi:DNA-binding MarR family transcriptional regulator
MPEQSLKLVDGLFELSFLLHGKLVRIAAAHRLTLVQVRLLGILRDREPGMNELARHLALEKSSLSGLVDRAEKRGLVKRLPSRDDRRAATVRVTAAGRALSRTIADQVHTEVAALLHVLPKSERKQLAALVGRVVLGASDDLSTEALS